FESLFTCQFVSIAASQGLIGCLGTGGPGKHVAFCTPLPCIDQGLAVPEHLPTAEFEHFSEGPRRAYSGPLADFFLTTTKFFFGIKEDPRLSYITLSFTVSMSNL